MFGREFKAAEHRRHIPPTQRVGYGVEPVNSRTADRWLLDDLAEMAGLSTRLSNGWEILQTNGGGPVLFREFNDYDSGKVSPPDSSGVWNWSVHARLYQVHVGSGAANTADEAMSMVEQTYAEYKRTASRKTSIVAVPAESLQVGDVIETHGETVTIIGEQEPWVDPFGREMFKYMGRIESSGKEGYIMFGFGGTAEKVSSRKTAADGDEVDLTYEQAREILSDPSHDAYGKVRLYGIIGEGETAGQIIGIKSLQNLDRFAYDRIYTIERSGVPIFRARKTAAPLSSIIFDSFSELLSSAALLPEEQKSVEDAYEAAELGKWESAYNLIDWVAGGDHGPRIQKFLEALLDDLSGQGATASRRISSRRTAFLDTVHFAEPRHRVAGWDWDDHLNGFIAAEAAREFTCACGDNIPAPGYTDCRCGKRWNAYAISANGSKKMIAREVPVRENVVMARTATRKQAATYHITQVQQDPSIVKPGDLIATDSSRGRVHKILPPDGMGIMVIMMEDGGRFTLRTSARKIAAPSSGADAIAQHFPGWRVDDENGNFWEIHSPGGEHAFIHEENGTYTLLMDDNTPDEFYETGLSFEDALAEVRAEGII